MTEAISLGIGAGLGILGIVIALVPSRQALAVSLRVLDDDPAPLDRRLPAGRIDTEAGVAGLLGPASLRSSIRSQLEVFFLSMINRLPALGESLRADLACTDTGAGALAERCVYSALAGAAAPFVAWALAVTGGIEAPLSLPVWVGLLGGTIGGLLPVMLLRKRAIKSRRQARRSVGCFLDLVVLALAGGLGIEGALHAAAAISDAPVSAKIVGVLDVARDSGTTPWDALAALGRDLGVVELVELASAVSLAGTEGGPDQIHPRSQGWVDKASRTGRCGDRCKHDHGPAVSSRCSASGRLSYLHRVSGSISTFGRIVIMSCSAGQEEMQGHDPMVQTGGDDDRSASGLVDRSSRPDSNDLLTRRTRKCRGKGHIDRRIRRAGDRSRGNHRGKGHSQGPLDQSEQLNDAPLRRCPEVPSLKVSQMGSTIVEVVIMLPAIMLVILLGVQVALWAVAEEVVQAAAATGSQIGAGAGGSPAAGASAVQSYLSAHGGKLISNPSIRIDSASGFIDVRVSASALQIIPLFHLGVSAVRVAPLQKFRSSG